MLDILDFIAEKGGDVVKLSESQRRRNASTELIDQVIKLYEEHREAKYSASQAGQSLNKEVKKLKELRKANDRTAYDACVNSKKELEEEKVRLEDIVLKKESELQAKLKLVGNYVHDSVPVSNDEKDNQIIRTWTPPDTDLSKRVPLSHHEILTRINGYDANRGIKIAGHRGYCLTGPGVLLNLALINYGLQFLASKGYEPIQTPHMMMHEHMAKTAQLEDFEETLYALTEKDKSRPDKYLIATSEQPLSVMHANEWLQDQDLPIKYAGHSSCYRKEAGAHGKETWGIYRTHQFDKVCLLKEHISCYIDSCLQIEQFLLTKPEKSWEAFDDMIGNSEEFYKSLNLPFQIVAIVSGALNNAASKKYDLEAWFPYQQEYKELVSCSNCTDYQTRALDIRFGANTPSGSKKRYVHALNSTLCATQRTMCAILENYQTDEGVKVPEVLRQYMIGAPELIPYSTPHSKERKKALPVLSK